MQTLSKITLPQPCNQQWDNMTAAENGRFCGSCNKTVVDFTAMTNQQIIDHLSAANNVCGRIGTKQFTAVNNELKQGNISVTHWWKRMVLAVAVLLSAQHVHGQSTDSNKPKTEQGQAPMLVGEIVTPVKAPAYKTVAGRVIDDAGEPVINALVRFGKKEVFTNINGAFQMQVPANAKSVEVKALGYETKTIKLKKGNSTYNITVRVDPVILGGLGAVKRPGLLKRLYYSFVGSKAKTQEV